MKLILFSVVAWFFIAESIGNPNDSDSLIPNFDESDESDVKDNGLHGFQDEDEILGSKYDDSDDSNAKHFLQNEDSEEFDDLDDGLYGFQDGDEELGSNFVDSDDSNAEDILKNEYADQLDESNNDLYGLQDDDIAVVPAMNSPIDQSSRNDKRVRGKRNCPACCPRCRTMACDNKEICPKARED